jgi:hypothetical protein
MIKIFICLSGLIFQSCEKNKDKGDFIVEGRVINIGSDEPIENVLVILYGGNPLSNPLMPGFNDNPPNGNNDTAYSDSNGEFYLQVKDESAAFLGWRKDGYKNGNIVWYSNDFNTKLSESGNKFFEPGTKSIIIEYEAECKFSPIFKKKGANHDTDTLIISITNYNNPNSFIKYRTYTVMSPFKLDSDFGYCVGNEFFYFKLEYTDLGIWETKIDSVYVESFETYSDTIYYE